MARIHGLKHVKRLPSADLAYHDALRAHTQGGFDQIPDGHRPAPGGVGISCFQADQVLDAHDLKFRRILYGNHTLILGDIIGKRVQKRSLPGARAAADKNVVLGPHKELQHIRDVLCDGAKADQLGDGHGRLRKLTDRHDSPFKRNGRQHHIHAGAVRKPRVHNRIGLIDLPSRQSHDALHHVLQPPLALEGLRQLVQPSGLLNKDFLRPVDHDLGNAVVIHDRVQQAEAADGAVHLAHDIHPFLYGQIFVLEPAADQLFDLLLQLLVRKLVQIKIVEYILLDFPDKLMELRFLHTLPPSLLSLCICHGAVQAAERPWHAGATAFQTPEARTASPPALSGTPPHTGEFPRPRKPEAFPAFFHGWMKNGCTAACTL